LDVSGNGDWNDDSQQLPSEIFLLSNLRHLDIEYSGLSMSMPTELALLTRLEELYLGSNPLEGTLPSQLGELTVLGERGARWGLLPILLYISLTQPFSCCISTETLELAWTEITGPIPEEVCQLRDEFALDHLVVQCPEEDGTGVGEYDPMLETTEINELAENCFTRCRNSSGSWFYFDGTSIWRGASQNHRN